MMSKTEAVFQLQNLREHCNSFRAVEGIWEADMEALDLAIKALRNQIPVRPILEADGYADGELVYDTWYCPSCDKAYEVESEQYNYCPNCGQAIDWREKE